MAHETESDEARQRSGRTKRERTRHALIAAADRRFRLDGWPGTRMQDVAADAGTSAATAFNHFPTKHSLIGAVFALHVTPEIDRASQQLSEGGSPAEVIADHVHRLASIARENQGLTVPFTGALFEYMVRHNGPPDLADPGDPRNAARFRKVVMDAVAIGQAKGIFRPYPRAEDIGAQAIYILFLRRLTRPQESAGETAEFTLTMLFGALDPDRLVRAGRDGRPFRDA